MIAIFLFYNQSEGKQHWMSFSKTYRHTNAIINNNGLWVYFDMDLQGIKYHILNPQPKSMARLIRLLKTNCKKSLTALVAVEVKDEERPRISWKPWWIRSCNEFNRYLTGVDVGLSLNPRHLYKKLLRFDQKMNYRILNEWSRENGKRWWWPKRIN